MSCLQTVPTSELVIIIDDSIFPCTRLMILVLTHYTRVPVFVILCVTLTAPVEVAASTCPLSLPDSLADGASPMHCIGPWGH